MKKQVLTLLITGVWHAVTHAQTSTPAQPTNPVVEQEAGFIYTCATAKPIVGWQSISVVLDRVGPAQNTISVTGYAKLGSGELKKIELCDKIKTAQSLINMLNALTNNKELAWRYLQWTTLPNRQFTFNPLTETEAQKLLQASPNQQ
ncbi:MAG: hypothetical protein ACRCV6_07715 [Formosimonas sp.]